MKSFYSRRRKLMCLTATSVQVMGILPPLGLTLASRGGGVGMTQGAMATDPKETFESLNQRLVGLRGSL